AALARVLDQRADPAAALLVRLERDPFVERRRVDEVLLGDLVDRAPERAAERGALVVAVHVEPDAVEPELEGDLEQGREALLVVVEGLHPRRGVAVLLVAPPRRHEAVAGVPDEL